MLKIMRDDAPLSVRGPARRQSDFSALLFDEVDLKNVLMLYRPSSVMVAIALGCARAIGRQCAVRRSGKKPLICHGGKKLGPSMQESVQVGMRVDDHSTLLYSA